MSPAAPHNYYVLDFGLKTRFDFELGVQGHCYYLVVIEKIDVLNLVRLLHWMDFQLLAMTHHWSPHQESTTRDDLK